MRVQGLMSRSYHPIRAKLARGGTHAIAHDTRVCEWPGGWRRRKVLATAHNPPPTPEHTGGCKALLRFSALRETRATGMRVPVHSRAFKSADVPYLDMAEAGTATATGAAYG